MTDSAQDFLQGFEGIELPEEFTQGYEVIECMSATEVGCTLLARQRDTGRLVVAKTGDTRGDVLGGRHIDGVPDFIETFEMATGVLSVREYARGVTADKLAGADTLVPERCVAIVVRLCDILSKLHSLDPPVIHRDLKPANIVVDGERVMLIDFGIAREYDEKATADTVYLGTREFAPPEQFGYSQTDCRTDIYSLGAVLYCLLTGRTDVANSHEQVCDKRLARVIAKCCAFAPKDRFTSADQVKRALTPHLMGKRVWSLHLGSVGLASIHELDGIKGIERLSLTDMRIADISGIESFPLVTYLDLSRNYSISDLTPLLKLPNLLQVTLSWNVREAAAELEKTAPFEIIISE